MTEEKARTKWCPMVRFNDSGTNRWTYIDTAAENSSFARCIASDCMMWRETYGVVVGDIVDISQSNGGYCGLGGKP